jgi:hypothetical protein
MKNSSSTLADAIIHFIYDEKTSNTLADARINII